MPVQTRSASKSLNSAKETGRIIIELRFRCEKTCAICMSSMYGDKVYHTPCGHTFHTECFKNQLKNMTYNPDKCACCRHDLLPALRQNDNLYQLLPPQPPSRSELDEFLELVAVYRLIHSRGGLINTVLLNRPMLEIPAAEPFPLMQENSAEPTSQPSNNQLQPQQQENNDQDSTNSNNSNESLDSEDVWFNNSRMFHRNIHRQFPENTDNNNTTIQNSTTNNVNHSPTFVSTYSFTYNPIDISNTNYIPYGNYEHDSYESDYDNMEEPDDMPELIDSEDMPDMSADPYDLDMFMSDNIDYPSTPPSSNSETESENDSETLTTVSI